MKQDRVFVVVHPKVWIGKFTGDTSDFICQFAPKCW